MLQTLGQAATQFAFGERGQHLGIDHNPRGLVERADEVFALRDVDPGLAAYRGVDHGEQTRRALHERDAAEIRRGGQARGGRRIGQVARSKLVGAVHNRSHHHPARQKAAFGGPQKPAHHHMVWVSAVDWIPAVDVGKLKNDEPKLLQANGPSQFGRINIVFYARPE